jgi:hypothetical protein
VEGTNRLRGCGRDRRGGGCRCVFRSLCLPLGETCQLCFSLLWGGRKCTFYREPDSGDGECLLFSLGWYVGGEQRQIYERGNKNPVFKRDLIAFEELGRYPCDGHECSHSRYSDEDIGHETRSILDREMT